MRVSIVLILLLLIGLLLFMRWMVNAPPEQVARAVKRGLVLGAAGVLVMLAVTGRLHWLFALLGAALPLAQRLISARRLYHSVRSGGAAPGGQTSDVSTAFLRMELDHDSGAMRGEVLKGTFAGRRIDTLTLTELLELYRECHTDPQSVAVLEAYLDREHGARWREAADAGYDTADRDQQQTAGGGRMSRAEALRVLGLDPGATRDDVLAAHRRLMQRLHPDRGGSDYLAARINEAKDVLLET